MSEVRPLFGRSSSGNNFTKIAGIENKSWSNITSAKEACQIWVMLYPEKAPAWSKNYKEEEKYSVKHCWKYSLNSNVEGSQLKGLGLPITQQTGLKDKKVKMKESRLYNADIIQ